MKSIAVTTQMAEPPHSGLNIISGKSNDLVKISSKDYLHFYMVGYAFTRTIKYFTHGLDIFYITENIIPLEDVLRENPLRLSFPDHTNCASILHNI